MKKIVSFLLSRWVLSFVGVAILAVLVWFFGPFIAALAGLVIRLVIIVALLAIWLGTNLWLDHRRRKRDAALAAGVAAADSGATARAEEVAALSAKLSTALSLLRRARGTRGYLYEQPWYVIIGPPGAGKTTALLNAGLKFPLAAELGQGAVAGVGGTRLCDWWFTDDAVLIDTAGRYTTQDSDASVDQAGWLGFLDLLKRTRERQPLNGVIVAISVADLAGADPAARTGHARAIRARIKEITTRLGVRVPVYAVFTKLDLIAGFTEFFDDLDATARSQVWGTSFPNLTTPQGPVTGFADAFRALSERLDQRLIDRLQGERSPDRRALIAGFPAQVASLEEPLTAFLTEAFAGSTLDPAPWLRGAYFSSGTQDGTPIDRLTGALSRAFGIDQQRAPSLRPQAGRSYFLGRLLREVIFNEAMLASANPTALRRRLLLRIGGYAGVGLVATIAVIGLLVSHARNAAAVARLHHAIATEQQTAKTIALNPVASADLAPIAPMLAQARALADQAQPTGFAGLGLNQGAPLHQAAVTVYRNALDRAMLPRLMLQLEAEMRGALNRPEFLYQATRVYLMLGNRGPLDVPLVEAWMKLDWQRLYPGPANQDLRASLMQNLTDMLARPLPSVPLDGALIETARTTFSRVPLSERVYSRIKDSAAAGRVPAWTPAGALGAAGAPLFVRASGKPLTQGIPGFYTVRGFYTVLLPALSHVSQDVARESWVLGHQESIAPNSPQLQSLEDGVIAIYQQHYITHWHAMIADLDLAPLGTAGQSVQSLYILSSPQSPMKLLLASMARQLTLTQAPKLPKGPPNAKVPAKLAAVSSAAARLKGLIGGPAANVNAPPPGAMVNAAFAPLRHFTDGPSAPIGLTLQLINQVQQQLAAIAATAPGSAGPAAPAAGGDAVSLLAGEAAHDPQPVRRWLQAITANADGLRGGSAAASAAAAFNAPGGAAQLCQAAVAGRYPFNSASAQDVPLADFAHLFAPGGAMDTFFNTQVRPFVNMTGRSWVVQPVNGITPPVSQGAVAEFQRAEEIQQIFFSAGATPTVQFTITPGGLSSAASQAVLQLGSIGITYAHGPEVPTQITWPEPNGMPTAMLTITPSNGGTPVTFQASGPWALFRLFNQASLTEDGSSDQYRLVFEQGGLQATFVVTAGSVFNPFTPGVLSGFRCPSLAG
ncbi:MAG TPA: type VI secretion system membrane subunit TssM [Acidiphilium sp.]|nr:MAG: type VI secretion protein VasK [Acidiphilium sp. 21-60-14]OYV92358.1 MAG: type VI secretion protein VasK [Acidiphilium sp. 37-60-79]OZB40322.1 MAG: type VI secretion protein VasK [Acidiphilium sp. 34-60-192]HQT88683.1 type VI secretion system membrane subunit TssM [Acidiphilium sp.]HQU24792.1 type VI secretion system membrane subunit TssM [Acidiphilium sp.]